MRKNNEVTEMNNSGNFPEELHGVYRGFMPTDESPIATGEFEVLVDSNKIMGRFATGLKIMDVEFPLSEFDPMSNKEIADMYQDGSNFQNLALQGEKFLGFRHKNRLSFVFTPNPNKDDFGLIMRGSIADFLGPTILYSPSQVRQGLFKSAVRKIMLSGGDFPRLKCEGRTPPKRSYFKRVVCLEI